LPSLNAFGFVLGWGEISSLAAAFIWAISTTLYRVYGAATHPAWITIFKGTIASVLLVTTVFLTGGFQSIELNRFLILSLSGVIGISLGDTAYFSAFPKIGAALTSAIQCLVPPMTALGAWLFLSETLNSKQILGLFVTCSCIAAIVVIDGGGWTKFFQPSGVSKSFKIGLVFAAIAAICQSTGVLLARKPLEGLSAPEGASHRILVSLIILILWERFRSRLRIRSLPKEFVATKNFWQIALASTLGTYLGLMAMVYGMTHAPMGVALTLNSTYPIWVIIIEVIFFGRRLRLDSFVFQCCAILGIFLIVS
jgi:drug/metabolite transporter (DMT)-like permease